jgi:hypothetical protein
MTTVFDGSATAYSEYFNGDLLAIVYTKVDFVDGSTFTITADVSGLGIWTETAVNASTDRAPSMPLHNQIGGAVGATIVRPVPLVRERIKIVIAGGGSAKSGTFRFIVAGGVEKPNT